MTTPEEPELVVEPRSAGPLIPLGDGRFVLSLLKLSFLDNEREAAVECDFEVVKGGRTKIKKIVIWGQDLSPSELRHYTLTRQIERAIARVMLQEVDTEKYPTDKHVVFQWFDGRDRQPIFANPVAEDDATRAAARTVARRRRITPERLKEVAEVYRAAGGGPAGIKAVAAGNSQSQLRHARRLVNQARERNFLGEDE